MRMHKAKGMTTTVKSRQRWNRQRKDLLMLVVVCMAGYSIFLVIISVPRKKFLVSSPKCQIPDIDPWDPSIREFVTTKADPIVCSTRPPLTYTAATNEGHQLRVAFDAVSHYAASARDVDCCHAVVRRNTDSDNLQSECVAFKSSVTLAREVQHVYVECVHRVDRSRVYANVHAVVQVTPELKYHTKRINVVMLGIDSMSRLNFRRTMPRTAAFLASSGWLEMKGYNKMADNTLPNLMALLMGLNEKQSRDIGCLLPEAGQDGFDHCPLIWQSFKRKGYVTAYSEDETNLSTFNYMSVGFQRRKPTDFYMHPLMVEARDKLTAKKSGGFSVCIGETNVAELILKNTLDLMATFGSNLFALTWLNNFSHDDHRLPATMDATMLRFFRTLKDADGFENTIFVFFSDHGFRYGPIRETYVGWLEECLPFLYFHLPPAFRAAFPEAAANLAGNGNRLTSPFDVHLTLRDVLEDRVGEERVGTVGCRTCVSLFRSVDEDRSCRHAGIPEHWCTCLEREVVDGSTTVVYQAALAAVADVNNKVRSGFTNYVGNEECAELSVSEVIHARAVVDRQAVGYDDYDVVFVASPGAVVLHATVRHWRFETEPWFQVLGMVSRISAMHGESCPSVTDKLVEYYCQCVYV